MNRDFIEYMKKQFADDDEREEFSRAFNEMMETQEEVVIRFSEERFNIIGSDLPGSVIECK